MTISNTYLRGLWYQAIQQLEEANTIPENILVALYEESFLDSYDEENVVISLPNLFTRLMVDQHSEIILEKLKEITNSKFKNIEFILRNEIEQNNNSQLLQTTFKNLELIPSYNFTNFIVGKCNIQAHVSSLTCASSPGMQYNPLFIYGNSGLGKTHLLNAIGNKVKQDFINQNIIYLTGQDFVDCVYNSSKSENLHLFKEELSYADILLIDDVQFIANKPKTHEIFFTVFNELIKKSKQICITCDRLPEEIKGLEERLVSRFNSGLRVNVEVPTYETSFNILKSKLEQKRELKKYIDEEALKFIATNFANDVRNLEGALNRLIFYGINFSQGERIDIEVAKEAFKNQVSNDSNELNIKKIITVVSEYYGLTKQQILSKNRAANIARARHIIIYLARKYLDLSYSKIGEEVGKRDHSTVMNSCYIVEKNMKSNEAYKKALEEIEKIINKDKKLTKN